VNRSRSGIAISGTLRMLHARSFRFSMTRLWRHLRIRDCGGNGGRARNADPGVLPAMQVLDSSVRRMILVRADTLGHQQNALGAPDMLLRGVVVADQRLELAAIRRGDRKRNFCAHAKDSHTKLRSGNPNGSQTSDFIQ
jgi:hypothetical protein